MKKRIKTDKPPKEKKRLFGFFKKNREIEGTIISDGDAIIKHIPEEQETVDILETDEDEILRLEEDFENEIPDSDENLQEGQTLLAKRKPEAEKKMTKAKIAKTSKQKTPLIKNKKYVIGIVAVIVTGVIATTVVFFWYVGVQKKINLGNKNSSISKNGQVFSADIPQEVKKLEEVITAKKNMPEVPVPDNADNTDSGLDPFIPLLRITSDIKVGNSNTANSQIEDSLVEWLLKSPDDVQKNKAFIANLYKDKTGCDWNELIVKYKEANIKFKETSTSTEGEATAEGTAPVYSTNANIGKIFSGTSNGYSVDVFILDIDKNLNPSNMARSIKVTKIFYDSNLELYCEFRFDSNYIYAKKGDQLFDGYMVSDIDYAKGKVVVVDQLRNEFRINLDDNTKVSK